MKNPGKMTLLDWQLIIRENNIAKGWRGPDAPSRTFGEEIALLHSEVSEALEAFRENEYWKWYTWETKDNPGKEPLKFVNPEDGWGKEVDWEACRLRGDIIKPHGVPSELADVFIRLCDLADQLGLNLAQEVAQKHEYNITRPWRHGGRAI